MAQKNRLEVGPTEADSASPEEALGRADYREALARVARVHGAGIGRLCMALTGSRAEADELVQEVLLLAYDAFPTFKGEGSLRAWLFGIARRVCARHLEKRTRQRSRLELVRESYELPFVDQLVIDREEAERARRALDELTSSEREAILLRYGADLSFREVADACGVDEATARKRVSRALGRLREILAQEKRRVEK